MYLAGGCTGRVHVWIDLSDPDLAVVGCIGHVELCVRRFGMMRVQMLPLAARLNRIECRWGGFVLGTHRVHRHPSN